MNDLAALDGLKIIPSVVGSFIAGWSGTLLASTLHRLGSGDAEGAATTATALARAAHETLGEHGPMTLDFGELRLHLLSGQFGVLCVLVEPDVNRNLLAVVMRMAARRLDPDLERPASRPPPLGAIARMPRLRKVRQPPLRPDGADADPVLPSTKL